MLTVKGEGNKIKLCFDENITLEQAIQKVREKSEFLKNSQVTVSYSGLSLKYNEEISFLKELRALLGDNISFVKKHRLSSEQILYSLDEDERICLVINKSLRSGEKVCSRGDVIIYGDVNPGAIVTAKGNITVLGTLRGEAHITQDGKVYATAMQPSQIRIGKVISYNKKSQNVGTAVAIAQNGEIILKCL